MYEITNKNDGLTGTQNILKHIPFEKNKEKSFYKISQLLYKGMRIYAKSQVIHSQQLLNNLII